MLLYSLKWRGLLGYEGRDQMLLESTHNLSTGFGITKLEPMIACLRENYQALAIL